MYSEINSLQFAHNVQLTHITSQRNDDEDDDIKHLKLSASITSNTKHKIGVHTSQQNEQSDNMHRHRHSRPPSQSMKDEMDKIITIDDMPTEAMNNVTGSNNRQLMKCESKKSGDRHLMPQGKTLNNDRDISKCSNTKLATYFRAQHLMARLEKNIKFLIYQCSLSFISSFILSTFPIELQIRLHPRWHWTHFNCILISVKEVSLKIFYDLN